MSLKHRKSVNVADDPAAAGKLRPSDWGSPYTNYSTTPTHVFDGGADGALAMRDTGSVDGFSWVPSAAGVLVSDGDDEVPEFRALVADDIPALAYAPADLTGLIEDDDIVSVAWGKLTDTPTTIGGYGITDFNSLGDARWDALGAAATVAGNLAAHAALTTTAHGLGASAFHPDAFFAAAAHVHSAVDITSGTLAVARGGTGTGTAFTAGSILFAGAGGVYSEDNANLFWDDTNNRLGVGTATPDSPLVLIRDLGVTSAENALIKLNRVALSPGGLQFGYLADGASVTGAYIRQAGAAGILSLGTLGVHQAVTIDAAGSVGIGTTLPSTILHAKSSTSTRIMVETSGAFQAGIRLSANSSNWTFDNRGAVDLPNNRLAFFAPSTAEVFTLLSGGNVGFGESNPDGGQVTVKGLAPVATGSNLDLTNIGGSINLVGTTATNGDGGAVTFATYNAATNVFAAIKGLTTNSTSGNKVAAGHLAFYTSSIITGTTLAERMRITKDGFVGVGIAAPLAQMQIAGNVAALPTTGVYQQLELTGATNSAIRLSLGTVTTGAGGAAAGTGIIQAVINASAFTNLALNPSGGNVGVGVPAPTAAMHIKAGTATAGTAPLKLTSGPVLTTPEAGAFGFLTDDLFFTITTGAARKGIVLDDGARLTSGKIPRATTNGRLIDGPTPLAGTKTYWVSDSSGGAVNRKLTFTDGILTAET